MLATTTQKTCVVHGLITPDEDGDCRQCLEALWLRLDEMAARDEHEHRKSGRIQCWCGGWAKPGAMHYPGNHPENGPAHPARQALGEYEGCARTWTNTRILGICGLTAAVLGFVGANIGMGWPRLGFAVTAVANGVMLAANLVLVFRKEDGG